MTYQPDRAERLAAAAARDGERCVWCRRPCVGLVRATTDHVIPKVKGGPSWLENEVVGCRRCKGERGHASPADWIAECERRGWETDVEALAAALSALERATAERCSQRRSRPYLAAQLRRLGRAPAA